MKNYTISANDRHYDQSETSVKVVTQKAALDRFVAGRLQLKKEFLISQLQAIKQLNQKLIDRSKQ